MKRGCEIVLPFALSKGTVTHSGFDRPVLSEAEGPSPNVSLTPFALSLSKGHSRRSAA